MWIAEVAAVGLIHCNVWPAATPSDGKCAMVPRLRWKGLLWRVEVEVEMEVTSLSCLPPTIIHASILSFSFFILILLSSILRYPLASLIPLGAYLWTSFIHLTSLTVLIYQPMRALIFGVYWKRYEYHSSFYIQFCHHLLQRIPKEIMTRNHFYHYHVWNFFILASFKSVICWTLKLHRCNMLSHGDGWKN